MNALQMVNELVSRTSNKEVSSFGGVGSDSAIALRKINLAQQMICTAYPFSWMQKTTPGTITAVAGTAVYSLASDVAHLIVAKHTYNGGGWIKVIDRQTLEQYRPRRTDTAQRNIPTHMTGAGAVLSGTAYLQQAEIWPIPDANFDAQTITYYYTFVPTDLANTTDVSIVPLDYHWLVLDMAETLWRTGAVRVGGDQNQIDLFSIADARAKAGLAKLISRESQLGAQNMSWEPDSPVIDNGGNVMFW